MQAGGAGSLHRTSHQDAPLQPAVAPAPAAPAAVPAAVPAAPADKSWFIPADFDTAAFLATAKARFIDLQAVWDSGDIAKLNEYMTDDLIAEVKPELMQRAGNNVTEVVLLNAELLGIEQVSGGHLASVRFSGMLRESAGAEAFRFEEVWNLYKADNAGWLLAVSSRFRSSTPAKAAYAGIPAICAVPAGLQRGAPWGAIFATRPVGHTPEGASPLLAWGPKTVNLASRPQGALRLIR